MKTKKEVFDYCEELIEAYEEINEEKVINPDLAFEMIYQTTGKGRIAAKYAYEIFPKRQG